MEKRFRANEVEYGELAQALDQLAERVPSMPPADLVDLWPGVERRVLARIAADEHDANAGRGTLEGHLLQAEEQRIRHLAWEVGVSVEVHAVHLRALRTLATLLHERERLPRFGRQCPSLAMSGRATPPGPSHLRLS